MERYKCSKNSTIMICSIIFTSLIINLFIRKNMDFSYLRIWNQTAQIKCQSWSGIIYIGLNRVKQLLLIFLLLKLVNREYIYELIILLLSAVFGLFMTVQSYYIGVNGIILLMLHILPHYVMYYFAMRLIYLGTIKKGTTVRNKKEKIFLALAVAGFILAGILSEVYISSFFVKKFYQYVVLT